MNVIVFEDFDFWFFILESLLEMLSEVRASQQIVQKWRKGRFCSFQFYSFAPTNSQELFDSIATITQNQQKVKWLSVHKYDLNWDDNYSLVVVTWFAFSIWGSLCF